METLSIEEWAAREGVSRRTAYYWARQGKRRKLPLVVETIQRFRVPASITKDDVVNGK
jgi:predicted site-specific integrase-resolvase